MPREDVVYVNQPSQGRIRILETRVIPAPPESKQPPQITSQLALSAAGLPQITAIMGNCVAGGAYLPLDPAAGCARPARGPAATKRTRAVTIDNVVGVTARNVERGTRPRQSVVDSR